MRQGRRYGGCTHVVPGMGGARRALRMGLGLSGVADTGTEVPKISWGARQGSKGVST